MRAVLTRVKSASVTINGEVTGSIGKGFLILLGVHEDDTETEETFDTETEETAETETEEEPEENNG